VPSLCSRYGRRVTLVGVPPCRRFVPDTGEGNAGRSVSRRAVALFRTREKVMPIFVPPCRRFVPDTGEGNAYRCPAVPSLSCHRADTCQPVNLSTHRCCTVFCTGANFENFLFFFCIFAMFDAFFLENCSIWARPFAVNMQLLQENRYQPRIIQPRPLFYEFCQIY